MRIWIEEASAKCAGKRNQLSALLSLLPSLPSAFYRNFMVYLLEREIAIGECNRHKDGYRALYASLQYYFPKEIATFFQESNLNIKISFILDDLCPQFFNQNVLILLGTISRLLREKSQRFEFEEEWTPILTQNQLKQEVAYILERYFN